jgi:hypothetical protein
MTVGTRRSDEWQVVRGERIGHAGILFRNKDLGAAVLSGFCQQCVTHLLRIVYMIET